MLRESRSFVALRTSLEAETMMRIFRFFVFFALLFSFDPLGVSNEAEASLVKQREAATETAPASTRSPGLWDRAVYYVQVQQQKFYRQLASAVKAVKNEYSLQAAWSLIFLSFLYGIFHAAGPGHGKTVISAYLLANEDEVKRGVLLAFLSSIMQAVTAILIVGVIVLALGFGGRSAQRSVLYLEQMSYALICVVGAYMLWRVLGPFLVVRGAVPATAGGHAHHGHGTHDHVHIHDEHDHTHVHAAHDHVHAHGVHDHAHSHGEHGHVHVHDEHGKCGCGHVHIPDAKAVAQPLSIKQAASIVFAVGIRPCSGAVLVLVFANAIGILSAGIVATFAMALGTFITVSALASLTLVSKNLATTLLGHGGTQWLEWTARIFGIVGAVLVFMLGAVLLAGSFGPQRPFI